MRRTRLRVGEGLIGEIAAKGRPLALADAQSHPNFAFRPETGEEIYHSLMGVPILRGGRVVGVLAVQNVEPPPVHRRGDRGAADGGHGAGRAGGRAASWSAATSMVADRGHRAGRRSGSKARG